MTGGEAVDHRERELKFDIPDGWTLPDPAKLIPLGGARVTERVRLESTYFDTAEQALLRARLTLRRRTGDIDVGWQLKVPDGNARTEIRLPGGGRSVPKELRDATLGVRARAALSPVVTVTTDREIHTLVGRDGTQLAEIVVDDVVSCRPDDPGEVERWREVEVELLAGDEELLARARRWLLKRGARMSSSASKLGRALGTPPRPAAGVGTLAALVGDYLDAQYEAIVRGDIDLRRGRDAIHATRVAVRRYRSVLRGFADVIDLDAATSPDAELRWFSGVLGAVRDNDVLARHLEAAVAALPEQVATDDVRTGIMSALAAERVEAVRVLETAMRSKRYLTLLRELRDRHEQPPVVADAPAADVARFLARAERAVRKRGTAVDRNDDVDDAVHRMRKAVKRARYLAELARPEMGAPAKKAQRRNEKLQKELGARQDHVTAAAFLLRHAVTEGPLAFAGGVLYERERRAAAGTGP